MPRYTSTANASAPKLSDRPASSTVGRLKPRPKSVIKPQRPSSQQFYKSSPLLRQDSVPTKFLIYYSPGPDPVSRVMRRKAVPEQELSHESAKPPDFTDAATRPSSRSRSIGRLAVPPQMSKEIFHGDLIPRYGDPSDAALKQVISQSWDHRCQKFAAKPYKGPRNSSSVFPAMVVERDLPLPSEVKRRSQSGKPAMQRAASEVRYSPAMSFPSFTELSTPKDSKKSRVSFAKGVTSPPLAADRSRGEAKVAREGSMGHCARTIYSVEQHQNEFTELKQQTKQRIQEFQEVKADDRNSKAEERSHTANYQSAVTGGKHERSSGIRLNQGENAVLLSPTAMHNTPEQQETETSHEYSVEFESGVSQQEEEMSTESKASDQCLNFISNQAQKDSTETGAQKSECVKKESSEGTRQKLRHGTVSIYSIKTDTNDDDKEGHSGKEDVRNPQLRNIAMHGSGCKQEVIRQSSERQKSQPNPSQTSESKPGQQSKSGLRTARTGAGTTHREDSKKCDPRSSGAYPTQDATKRKPPGQDDAVGVKRQHGGKCPSQQTQAAGVQQKQKSEKQQCAKEQSGSATQKDTPLDDCARQLKDQRCPPEIRAATPTQPTSQSRQEIPASCQEALKLDAERWKRRESAEQARLAALRNVISGRPCPSGWPANNAEKKRPTCKGEKPPPTSNGEKPPTCNGEKPPPTSNGEKPPPTYNGEKPPHTCNGEKPPPTYNGEKPPHTCNGEKPPPTCDGENPPHTCNGEKPPRTCNGEKPPPPCNGEKPYMCKHDKNPPVRACGQDESSITWIRECSRMVKLVHGEPIGIQVISRLSVHGGIYWITEADEDWPLDCEEEEEEEGEGAVPVSSDPPSDSGAEKFSPHTDEVTGDPVVRTKKCCC